MLAQDRDLKLYRTLSLQLDDDGAPVQAGGNPLSLAEVKKSLRIDHDDDDDLIQSFMDAALALFDGANGCLGRAFLTQKWELRQARFSRWPYYWGPAQRSYDRVYDPLKWLEWMRVEIPLPPLQSIDSIQYYDGAGVLQTLDPATYTIQLGGVGMWALLPLRGQVWPACDSSRLDAVRIKFTAGYKTIPALKAERKTLLQAMMLMVGLWNENREAALVADRAAVAELPFYQALIAPHVLSWF